MAEQGFYFDLKGVLRLFLNYVSQSGPMMDFLPKTGKFFA